MPETVSIDSQHSMIVIDSSGNVEARDLSQSLESVLRIVRAEDIKNVMVDARWQSSLASTIALYSFGCELAKQTQSLKHALVIADRTSREMSFIEAVAFNRGVSIRSFSSTEDALSWFNQ